MSREKTERVEEAERRIQEFSAGELAAFREWFLAFDTEAWDRQIEEDVRGGKLNALTEKALKDFTARACSKI